MTNRKINIGIIGNGKSANRYHIPYLLCRTEKFNLKTIYRRSPKHDSWKYINGVNYIDDMEELLNDASLDLIIVCTPIQHYELAKLVLEHNHHCLVEKPFTDTYEQAKELFDLANSKNLVISAYQNRRYDSDFLTAQKVIESGKLGELFEIEMSFDYYRASITESDYFYKVNKPYYSFFYGHGAHGLDQVISYFGKPDDIHYDVRQLHGKNTFNDYYDVDLFYGNLKVSVKSSYYRIKKRPSIVIYGKQGMFTKLTTDRQEEHLKLFYMPNNEDFGLDEPRDYGVLTYYDEDGNYHEEKVESLKGDFGIVYDGLYETIVNKQPQQIKPNETLLLMEMLEKGSGNLQFEVD